MAEHVYGQKLEKPRVHQVMYQWIWYVGQWLLYLNADMLAAWDPFGNYEPAPESSIAITPYADGSYCCGSNKTCCSLGDGVFINDRGEETKVNSHKAWIGSNSTDPSSTSASVGFSKPSIMQQTLASTTKSPLTSASATLISTILTSTPSTSSAPIFLKESLLVSNDKEGVIKGAAVGSAAGLILVLGSLYFLWRRHRAKSQTIASQGEKFAVEMTGSKINKSVHSELPAKDRPYELDSTQLMEMLGPTRHWELPAKDRRYEADNTLRVELDDG